MLNSLKKHRDGGVSLIWPVAIVILISMTLVTFSLFIFAQSGAYDTVKQISAAVNSLEDDDLEGYDTKSPIQANEIKVYGETLDARVRNLNDQDDFNQEAISEKALGY